MDFKWLSKNKRNYIACVRCTNISKLLFNDEFQNGINYIVSYMYKGMYMERYSAYIIMEVRITITTF